MFSNLKKLFSSTKTSVDVVQSDDSDEMLMVTGPNGEQILADKSYRNYLASNAPDPTQKSLNKILQRTSLVRVIEGGMQDDNPLGEKLLFQSSDSIVLDELRYCLQIADGGNGHCMCHGEPTLELYSSYNERLAVIGLHHGESIRWHAWKDDAKLVDGRYILHWLAQNGVEEPLKAWQDQHEQQDVNQQAWNRWIKAMPECLKTLPTEVWDKVYQDKDVTSLTYALADAYPDLSDRILALYEWFGHGAGSWNGFQAYELVAQHLLLQYSCDELISAAQKTELNVEQIEGAGRLFASADFQNYSENNTASTLNSYSYGFTGMAIFSADREDRPAAIPTALREIFLTHYQNNEDEEKRKTALSAFAI